MCHLLHRHATLLSHSGRHQRQRAGLIVPPLPIQSIVVRAWQRREHERTVGLQHQPLQGNGLVLEELPDHLASLLLAYEPSQANVVAHLNVRLGLSTGACETVDEDWGKLVLGAGEYLDQVGVSLPLMHKEGLLYSACQFHLKRKDGWEGGRGG